MKKITLLSVMAILCPRKSIADGPWSPPRRAGIAGTPQDRNSSFFKRKFSLGCTMVFRLCQPGRPGRTGPMVHSSWPMAGFLQRKDSTLKRKIYPGNKTTMVYRLLTMVLFSLFTSLAATAQTEAPIWSPDKKPDSAYLTIGKTVPDILLYRLSNPSDSKTLSSQQARLTILDFWSTTCGACLRNMPKVQDLVKQYKGQLSVLLINSAYNAKSAAAANAVLQQVRTPANKKITLPPFYMDVNIRALFFFMVSVPHYIWLDRDRKIIATTNEDAVTAENIAALLAGKTLMLPTKPAYIDDSINAHQQLQPVWLKP